MHTHYISAVMSKDQIAEHISELRTEAAGARWLAATFEGGAAVRDLLNYASALDGEAAQLEKASPEYVQWSLPAARSRSKIAAR